MEKKWILKQADENTIAQIQKDLNLHPSISRILALRGITNFQNAKDFFRPSLSHLHSPFLMKGMNEAIACITRAKDSKQKVMVYGDYDVDGTTAVAVVYSFLKKYAAQYPDQLSFYIPNRYTEGYGISFAGIDEAERLGCSLIIALDCGIKAIEKAQYAKSKNISLIICDHHLPDHSLPEATAILNPKQLYCNYPYKELTGCGIGFKLITALANAWQLPEDSYLQYLDLVAISIAADIVPMNGENRVLAYYGLQQANEHPRVAITALKKLAAVNRDMDIADLVFIIAPRINAAGRMGDAKKAVNLFVETDEDKAYELASLLQSDNYERREIDQQMTEEALGILQNETVKTYATVVYRPHWHKGVVGIVASRLTEHYYRPTIVLTESNGKVTGSARSVRGFSIYNAIHECRDYLENYGGHNFAAGLTMAANNLDSFRERFEEIVSTTIHPDSLYPVIEADAIIPLSAITPSFYNIIQQLAPYGPENLKPVFISRRLRDTKGFSRIVKEQHLKISANDGNYAISGIAFKMADKFELVKDAKAFDMIYTLEENEWNGRKSLEAKILDIVAS